MLISLAEFEIALRGLLRLARFDAGFAGFFDLSRDGARRSFRLALPLLPLYLVLLHLNADWPDGTDMVRVIASELIGYGALWCAFPLLLISTARMIDRGPRIWGAIAIYNWLSVLAVAIQLPIEVATFCGLAEPWGDRLGLLAQFFVIACEFFAFKRVLDIGIELTIGLVVVEFILGQIVFSLMTAMAHAPLL
jgi:hypothetical protein